MSGCDQLGLIPIDEALEKLLDDVVIQEKIEQRHISQALGYILAECVVSQVNVPPNDNSAMDGYAVNISNPLADTLRVSQRITAGRFPQALEEGTAARIFTGAVIPEGANAVVMQEQCVEVAETVSIPKDISLQQNIRPLGQDIQSGSKVLEKGHRLRAQDLGLLASVGIEEVTVYTRLKVAILSTGDELLEPGDKPQPGKIYNSNRYALIGLLQAMNIDYFDLGVVEDTLEASCDALQTASSRADIIITTGGVSVGEEDHVKAAMEQLGQVDLWRLAIKPGKPLAYGKVVSTPILCLPGNPVAAFVTFCIVARPYILKKQGASNYFPILHSAKSAFTWPRAGKRQEYLRGRLDSDKGSPKVIIYPNQSSGVLTSISWADLLIIVPIGKTIEEGDEVNFYSLSDLMK